MKRDQERWEWIMKSKVNLILLLIIFSISLVGSASAVYDDWDYKKPVNVTENSGSSLTDYQVLLTVDTASLISAGKMQADCDDIRFTDSDETTELSYWLESGCNTANTKVWVKVPSLAASSTRTFYMYYGNASAGTESNGTNTFMFFDDFSASTFTSYENDCKSDSMSTSTTQSGAYRSSPYGSYLYTGSGGFCGDAGLVKELTLSEGNQWIDFYVRGSGDTWASTRGVSIEQDGYGYGPIACDVSNYNNMYWLACARRSSLACGGTDPETGDPYTPTYFPNSWTSVGKDISRYASETIRLRIMVHDSSNTYCNYGDHSQWLYVDDIRIRKYTSLEPTYTITSEQQNVAVSCTDNDGDGYGAEGTNLTLCGNPTISDCNDTNSDINPEAYDIVGNGIDEDCSGTDADYNFSIETEFLYPSETSTYYVGDDIWYQVTIKRDGVLYDPPGIKLNLTNHYGTLYHSHAKQDMTYVSSGVYKGYFDSTTFDNNVPDIRYDVWIYGSMNELLDYNVHYDFTFPDGTAPSLSSTTYTVTTNAISNYTVKNLVVNSSEAKIDWSESTLDLHTRNIDLDSALTIGDRSAYLDSAAYSELNNSATITFYNVNCASAFVFYSETANSRLAILAENKQCLPPRCTDIQCAGSTLTVTVSSFTGYAAESDANLLIDADDPKFAGAEVHFTADYRNVTDDSFISGASCTIYFTDGNYPMAEGADIYTYNRTFAAEGLKDYNITCSKAEFSTLTAFDNATIVSVEIPEFSTITLGLGLIIILIGLFIIRLKK